MLAVSDPGQEVQSEAARQLKCLQSLGGGAEREGDLEAILCVQHELGGAFTVLLQRLSPREHIRNM